MPLPESKQIQQILCLMLADIGDIIVTTPTLAALRDRYPHANIVVIARKPFIRLFEHNTAINKVLIYDASNLRGKLKLLVQLMCYQADLWVDLHVPTYNTLGSNKKIFLRNELLARLVGATFRAGYQAYPWQRLTHATPSLNPQQKQQENIVLSTMRIVNGEANKKIKPAVIQKTFFITETEHAWAQHHLDSDAQTMYIGLFYGSKQAADRWPEAHILDYMHKTLNSYADLNIILIGGKLEENEAKRLVAQLSSPLQKRVINACGQSSLGESAALIVRCALFVSTDAGPLHLADALKVPIIALFSSKNYPNIWRPIQSRHILLNEQVPCAPCFSAQCKQKISCMSLIQPDAVFTATQSLLEEIRAIKQMTPTPSRLTSNNLKLKPKLKKKEALSP